MITAGVLLIEPGALRPPCFEVEAGPYPNGWMAVQQTLTPQQLDKELSATGWTFFFMAGPIRTTAFGFNRDKSGFAALARGIKAARQQRCNCLQIDSVEARSFLWIPYVRMTVRVRHIQQGVLFSGASVGDGAEISAPELSRDVVAT